MLFIMNTDNLGQKRKIQSKYLIHHCESSFMLHLPGMWNSHSLRFHQLKQHRVLLSFKGVTDEASANSEAVQVELIQLVLVQYLYSSANTQQKTYFLLLTFPF